MEGRFIFEQYRQGQCGSGRWGIYREMAHEMMRLASAITYRDDVLYKISEVFGLSGFFAIDSSTVSLELNKFPWSVPQQETGGIKLHTMFDLLRNVPQCFITGHEEKIRLVMRHYPVSAIRALFQGKIYFKAESSFTTSKSKGFFYPPKNVRYLNGRGQGGRRPSSNI